MQKTTEIKSFPIDKLPEDTLWEFYCRYDNVIRKGNCNPTVLDFNLTDPESGANLNDSLLHLKGIQFMLIMHDIDKADRKMMGKVNLFYDACAKNKTPFNALSMDRMSKLRNTERKPARNIRCLLLMEQH